MSKMKMTVRQIMDLGLWKKVCEYKNWCPWILNEGRIDYNDIVEFDSEFKKEDYKEEDRFYERLDVIETELKLLISCLEDRDVKSFNDNFKNLLEDYKYINKLD